MLASKSRGFIVLNIMLLSFLLNHGAAGQSRLLNAQSTAQAGDLRTLPVKNASRRSVSLDKFIRGVRNGKAKTLAGIYLSQDASFSVMQQPAGNSVFVYTLPGVVTQYHMANMFGTIGILAHNTLAGASFLKLKLNQPFTIVYGDGKTRQFEVTTIKRFQALDSENPYSDFVDLDQPDKRLSSGEVFSRMYTRGNEVVLQTCLERDGNTSWGRIFVTASPVHHQSEAAAFFPSLVAFGR
jgi:hypothetical protein